MKTLTYRFFSAVRICTSDLTIKQRLAKAWIEYLDEIEPNDLPQCQRPKFIELRENMYERQPLNEESAPQASIRKMSARQVVSQTGLIIEIYAELVRIQNSPTLAGTEVNTNSRSNLVTSLEDEMLRHLN